MACELEEREREKTGIKNLRVRFNKVFGYYIEVTNSYKDLVPDYYIRRQTLANAERYTTEELSELARTILGARINFMLWSMKHMWQFVKNWHLRWREFRKQPV